MKKNVLLKSFLVLSLLFALSSSVLASEVTGTLSSSANGSGDQTYGTIGGTVEGGGSGGGGSSGSSRRNTSSQSSSGEGTVLGASTENIPVPNSNSIAYGGTALQPSESAVSFDFEDFPDTTEVEASYGDVLGAEVATAEASTGFGWLFWILLIILLVVISIYIYNRNKNESNSY